MYNKKDSHTIMIYKLKKLQNKIEKNKNKTFFFGNVIIDDRQYIIGKIIDHMKDTTMKFPRKFLNKCNEVWDFIK